MIFRRIGVFLASVKNKTRLKKNKVINLAFTAHNHRDGFSLEKAFEVAALFTHFAPSWQNMMTADAWGKLVAKFKRGGLDSALDEKVSAKRGDVEAASFSFLAAYGVQLVGPAGAANVSDLDAQVSAAAIAREAAQVQE